jgi:hypothetical protein
VPAKSKIAWRAVRLLGAERFALLHIHEAGNRGSSWLAIHRSCGNNKIVTRGLRDVLGIVGSIRAVDKRVCGASDMIACCSQEL